MTFTSQICTTKEYCERLLALGLKKETADMAWVDNALTEDYEDWKVTPIEELDGYDWNINYIPAWSLHRLLCLLPTEYIADIDFQQVIQDFLFRSHDMYDEVISCIEILIKEGYFNKDYLGK